MLRFVDSFDHYTAGVDKLTKWTEDVNATGQVAAGIGRFGTAGFTNALDTRSIRKTLDSQGTWIVGTAFRANGNSALDWLGFWDSNSIQFRMRRNPGGNITAWTGGGVLLGTGTAVLSLNTFYYLEVKLVISDTVGVVEVRINGSDTPDLLLTGQDTKTTANATANQISINAGAFGGAGITQHFDDIYICDGQDGTSTQGAPFNDFLGDVRIQVQMPNGNGAYSQFDGSDADSTDNYLLVDEAAPDGDTTYVESADVGDADTYALGNVTPVSGLVYGVQTNHYVKKSDAGARGMKGRLRLAGTDLDGAETLLTTTYQYLEEIHCIKPGGGAFTIADLNSLEVGQVVSS